MSEQSSSGDAAQPSSPDEKSKTPNRVIIADADLSTLSSNEWLSRWRLQENYVNSLEHRVAQQEGRYSIHMTVDHFDYNYYLFDTELTWDISILVSVVVSLF